ADALGVAVPSHRLPEVIELGLVGKARHEHEAHLEGGRGLLEYRVKARLVAHGAHRNRAQARLVRRRDGGEERAETIAADADSLRVDLGARRVPVAAGLGRRLTRQRLEEHTEARRLLTTRPELAESTE